MPLRVLSWNLFHGRDWPPDPRLRTWRSRILRIEERNETHLQVNRDLEREFTSVLAAADWDVAALQESPPRWATGLAGAAGAEAHVALTSRNSLGALRALLARQNPDLVASTEGGSNLTLVRPSAGGIRERRELVLRPGPSPERRAMAFTRLGCGVCVANLHASTTDDLAGEELLAGADAAIEWAAGKPVVLAGDFNVRPGDDGVYRELAARGFTAPGDPAAIDHVLARGLEPLEPARAWPPEAREVRERGLAIRLSDHAPVEATFALPAATAMAEG